MSSVLMIVRFLIVVYLKDFQIIFLLQKTTREYLNYHFNHTQLIMVYLQDEKL